MVVGKLPFDGPLSSICTAVFESDAPGAELAKSFPAITPDFQTFLDGVFVPEDRRYTAAQFMEALEKTEIFAR